MPREDRPVEPLGLVALDGRRRDRTAGELPGRVAQEALLLGQRPAQGSSSTVAPTGRGRSPAYDTGRAPERRARRPASGRRCTDRRARRHRASRRPPAHRTRRPGRGDPRLAGRGRHPRCRPDGPRLERGGGTDVRDPASRMRSPDDCARASGSRIGSPRRRRPGRPAESRPERLLERPRRRAHPSRSAGGHGADRRHDGDLRPRARANAPRMLVTNRDVTTNARLEDEMAALASLVTAAGRARTEAEVANTALEILCRATGADAGLVGSSTGFPGHRQAGREPVIIELLGSSAGPEPRSPALQQLGYVSATSRPRRSAPRSGRAGRGRPPTPGRRRPARPRPTHRRIALGWRTSHGPPRRRAVLQAAALIAAALENARLIGRSNAGSTEERAPHPTHAGPGRADQAAGR